jgi:DNA-binding CsgD family transcriptional regulator
MAVGRLSATSMEAAQRCGDPLAQVAAARARQLALAGPEHADERLRLAGVIGEAGRALRRPSVAQWEPIWRIDALVELGQLPEARAELVELRRRVDEIGLPMSRFHLLRTETLLAQGAGRFADALDLGRQTCELFSRYEDPLGGQAMLATLRTIIGLHAGFDEEIARAFDEIDLTLAPPFLGDLPLLGPLVGVLGHGDTDQARHLYDRMAPVAAWEPPRFLWLHLTSLRLWAAIGLGRTDDVAALAAVLDDHRGLHVAAGAGGLTYGGPVELWTGLAALALEQWNAAVDDLGEAQRVCRQNGAAGFAVQAGVEQARARLARDGDGDREAAVATLAAVRPSADALGMAPWCDAIDQLDLGSGAAHASDVVDPGPLSPREYEVAGLVAEGLTNQAIAERLFLSVRTAQNHVQHILTKLGLSNRAQIATWYARRQ